MSGFVLSSGLVELEAVLNLLFAESITETLTLTHTDVATGGNTDLLSLADSVAGEHAIFGAVMTESLSTIMVEGIGNNLVLADVLQEGFISGSNLLDTGPVNAGNSDPLPTPGENFPEPVTWTSVPAIISTNWTIVQ